MIVYCVGWGVFEDVDNVHGLKDGVVIGGMITYVQCGYVTEKY